MKEKILSITLAAILAFSCIGLSACGKKSNAYDNATPKERETAKWMGEHGYFNNK